MSTSHVTNKYHDFEMTLATGCLSARNWKGERKTPVIALHGWLDNLESFSPLIEEGNLLQQGWDITTVDLAGHGNSFKKASGENYHFIDNVAELIEFTEKLHWDRFFILGHSMGAAIGSLIAASFPEKVKGLISIEALGPLYNPSLSHSERIRKYVLKRLQKPSPKRQYATIEEAIKDRMQWHKRSNDGLFAMIERNLLKVNGGYQWKTDRRLRWPSPAPLTEEQIEQLLQAIECPVLYIEAEQGHPYIHQLVQKRQHHVKKFQRLNVQGDHHCHMEFVNPIASACHDFLQSCYSD